MGRMLAAAALAAGVAACLPHAAAACAPTTEGFVVSPAGDDTQDGSASAPFRTLERARRAMRGGVRTVFLEGGVYALPAPLRLGAEESGATLLNCPGEAPALDGGAAGLETLVEVEGAADVVLRGLTFAHAAGPALVMRGAAAARVERNLFADNGGGVLLQGSAGTAVCANRFLRSADSAIEAKDGSDGATIAANEVDGVDAPATHGGGIFVHGAADVAIVRNLVRNTRGLGIGVLNWDDSSVNRRILIAGNVVRRANRGSEDSGAIYLLGRSHIDQQARIEANLVEDAGAPGDAHTIGIYLDDSTSGVVVARNIVRRPGTHAIELHGGDDVLVHGNLLDLGSEAASAVLFQAAPADTRPANTMRGNAVSQNLILMRSPAQTAYTSFDGGDPAIAGNLLVRPPGAPLQQASTAADLVVAPPPAGDRADEAAILAIAGVLIGFVPIEPPVAGPQPGPACPPRPDPK